VIKQTSPITVAGAALEWPKMAHQLPDYPLAVNKTIAKRHLMLKIQ